jgi:hypothetical protein
MHAQMTTQQTLHLASLDDGVRAEHVADGATESS